MDKKHRFNNWAAAGGAKLEAKADGGAVMAGGLDRKPEEVAEHASDAEQASDAKRVPDNTRGLAVPRHFTRAGVDPMDEVEWEFRSAVIAGEDGRVVFEQQRRRDAARLVADRRPTWSSPSTSADRWAVAAARDQRAPAHRCAWSIRVTGWGEKQSYFRDRRRPRHVSRRADPSAAAPEGRVQQPGVLQRRNRAQAAMLRLLHPARSTTTWSRS